MQAGPRIIDDSADPRLDDYRDIRDRDARGPDGRRGLFIGETALVVERMLAIPGLTRSVLVTPAAVDRLVPLAGPDVPVYVAGREILEQVAGFDVHRGVLAVGLRPGDERLTLDAAVPRSEGALTVLLCEEINNIDNIGMLFRNAAALAVDAVVLSPGCHDPLYRKSVRVSMGGVLSTPWARSRAWVDDLRRLRTEWGLSLVAAHPGPGAVAIDAVEPPPRVGLVVGHEFEGVSDAALAECDAQVRIPMAEGVDSLNVSVAAAVCLHRLSRGERR